MEAGALIVSDWSRNANVVRAPPFHGASFQSPEPDLAPTAPPQPAQERRRTMLTQAAGALIFST